MCRVVSLWLPLRAPATLPYVLCRQLGREGPHRGINSTGCWIFNTILWPLLSSSCNPPGCKTAAHQAPLSMGYPRQESWSGLPFPSPGHLPDPGIEPRSPAYLPEMLPFPLLLPPAPSSFLINIVLRGASLTVQWLRFHASNAGGLGSGWGTGIRHAVGFGQKVKKNIC